ncbi:MAG TPA: hypothetical protein VNE42_07555 [Acidimicrobiales bacterium]|nr:hypothetical protein [Acidimicrobiales bacterium]
MIDGKMTPGSDDEYARLTAELPPRPIRTADDARVIEARIAELVSLQSLSDAQRDYLDVLSDQFTDWEEATEEIPDVAGVELVRFLLEEQGLRQKDLVSIFGTESIASEVLSGRRELQRKHIGALSSFFNVSPSAFFPRSSIEPSSSPTSPRGANFESKRQRVRVETEGRRVSILVDAWATAAVDYARTVITMDVALVDANLSASEKVKTAKRENAVLYTFRTATASLLRLTEIGQMVLLASKEFGASTQTRLFEKVSLVLLGQNQSAGLPSHERILVDRYRIDLVRFNTGSIVHTETIPLALETS